MEDSAAMVGSSCSWVCQETWFYICDDLWTFIVVVVCMTVVWETVFSCYAAISTVVEATRAVNLGYIFGQYQAAAVYWGQHLFFLWCMGGKRS